MSVIGCFANLFILCTRGEAFILACGTCIIVRPVGVLVIKAKTVRVMQGIVSGLVALGAAFFLLRPAAELCAVLIRKQWPGAWFSGFFVCYADFLTVGFSIVIAVSRPQCHMIAYF